MVDKIVNPLKRMMFRQEPALVPVAASKPLKVGDATPDERFPEGLAVYGFTAGPNGGGEVLVGASDPATSKGALFLGDGQREWERIELPEETALLNRFVRFPDGRYLAGGMNAIGRGVILISDAKARNWKPVDLDLHSYSSISSILLQYDGSLLVATGQMVTQGKTKPVCFRALGWGATWNKEEHKLPITQFLSFDVNEEGTIFAGTAGDVDPFVYRSDDGGKTFEPLPGFPTYKTYKMTAVKWVRTPQGPRLFVVLWGYKTDIAERVVRIYVSDAELKGWEELPLIEDSHFIFSFTVAKDQTLYVGSEKGKVYRSQDFGRHWERIAQFSTNIGAHAIHEDEVGRIWIGKDFVAPTGGSLWRIAQR